VDEVATRLIHRWGKNGLVRIGSKEGRSELIQSIHLKNMVFVSYIIVLFTTQIQLQNQSISCPDILYLLICEGILVD
jgi:hypothetical protein